MCLWGGTHTGPSSKQRGGRTAIYTKWLIRDNERRCASRCAGATGERQEALKTTAGQRGDAAPHGHTKRAENVKITSDVMFAFSRSSPSLHENLSKSSVRPAHSTPSLIFCCSLAYQKGTFPECGLGMGTLIKKRKKKTWKEWTIQRDQSDF